MAQYRTAPVPSTTMPKGIPYIVGNEAAERFSYYGMRTILVIFMTKYLLDSEGNPDVMTGEQANVWFHTFTMAVYFFPFLGAILADAFLGKYRTILSLSVVYVLGHAVLAIADTSIGASIVEPRTSLAIGLGLIAFGSGGIKPCVSAHVGDQFGKSNAPLLERVFQWFYFSINLGSTISTLLTPWLLAEFGPHIAFGIPGILMFLATVVFWMGRKVFIHIPPGGTTFLKETFSKTGLATLGKLAIIYVFLFPFWALFDQTGSSWVLQAERMDRHLGIEWLSSQIQATNPILVMILIPIFGYGIYPAINKFFPLTPIRKIAIGLFVTVPSFLIIAYAEMLIQDGGFPSIGWQLLAYLVITAAEVMVSITALEFSYTQAPKTMKSVVMATFFFSIVVGNFAVALTNQLIQNPQPSFVADAPGLYTVELAANDGTDRVVERGTIEVVREKEEAPATPPADKPPSAEAGQIVAVAPGTEVRLYASADDGDARGDSAYAWAFESKPAGSRIEDDDLRDAHTRNPTFTPDVAGEYVLEFRYRVGDQAASDTVTIHATTENMPPVVAVSLPEVVELSDEPIALDGSSTFDPNGDTLRYYWRFVDVPAASELSDDDLIGRHYPTATSTMDGPDYFLFFAGLMFLCALLFIPVGYFYKEKTYIQDEDDGAAAPAADVAVETPGHDGDDDDGGNDGGNDDEPRARG